MGKLIEKIKIQRKSLKFSLILYYLLIFIGFVVFYLIFTYFSLRSYYYDNLENLMLSQSKFSVEIYESSISRYSISEVVFNERFEFLNNIDGQVQLLNNSGELFYDSTGSSNVGEIIIKSENMLNPDGEHKFENDIRNRKLSLNYPIKVNNNQIGVLRTISDTRVVRKDIARQMRVFILLGVFSLIAWMLLLYYFADKLLKPINKLTSLASKLSDGQYNQKSNMEYSGEIGELAKTMDELSENIIKKEEIKTDFISSVSHELRTPLTSIKGWALTIQDNDIDPETRKEGIMIIEQEADRLSEMVEDLLDFSRYTSPSFNLTKTEFDIVPVVKNIVNQMSPRSKEKKISLIFDTNVDSAVIVGDNNRLKQVLINLIDNAIKFTLEDGSVIVSINKNEELDEIDFEVVDTGIGISEDDIELVTTKFYKGTSKGSNTGLGLSIAEEIIIKHGGKLEIQSKLGEGTAIRFNIPIGGSDEKN
ncbi:sensor histidine kinase [Helcococcus sueciensis]|uniref:sensor histidine kinase n=1 Tax=Helcococcus sueciensis TaxID=241555 RepID=UPI000557CBED|nr:HAMP domain-containing sensor histidine kinase [Helcococcus sueciensis]